MEEITDLRELLKHELKDLYSAETQIIDGMPKMIEKAKNPQLKKAFSDHLKVTREQKQRLEKIQDILEIVNDAKEDGGGFFANLFKSKEGEQHCKAMEGLIKEGESIMEEDMEPDVMDAALIAAAQKIEHYEIGSYGTARAYAEQMGMKEVEGLLRLTLDEEYFADDSLTKIALERVNIKAEAAGGSSNDVAEAKIVTGKASSQSKNKTSKRKAGSNGMEVKGLTKKALQKTASKAAPSKSAAKKSPGKKINTAVKKSAPKKVATQKSAPQKAAVKKSAPKKVAAKKAAAKKSAPKKVAVKKSAPKKTAVKKSVPKKAMAKKATPKKVAVKKSAPKKAMAKKATAKKSAPKKAIIKKAAPKKVSVKKAASKKVAVKKAAPKKAAPKKTPTRGATGRKSAPKKSAAKKATGRR